MSHYIACCMKLFIRSVLQMLKPIYATGSVAPNRYKNLATELDINKKSGKFLYFKI